MLHFKQFDPNCVLDFNSLLKLIQIPKTFRFVHSVAIALNVSVCDAIIFGGRKLNKIPKQKTRLPVFYTASLGETVIFRVYNAYILHIVCNRFGIYWTTKKFVKIETKRYAYTKNWNATQNGRIIRNKIICSVFTNNAMNIAYCLPMYYFATKQC